VQRIDTIFEIERTINDTTADERLAVRKAPTAPLVADLERWLRDARATMARHNPVAGVIDYMLKAWDDFARFLTDGRICLTNNAAERAMRAIALGRKAWLFAGSDRGGRRAAFMYTLITSARLNDIDPQAWLADVLARIADIPQTRSTNCSRGTGNRPINCRPSRTQPEPRPLPDGYGSSASKLGASTMRHLPLRPMPALPRTWAGGRGRRRPRRG
jgi:hypothetical protein